MGRILAIDYGQKRVGLAVTDPLQLIATPLVTLKSSETEAYLSEYLKNEAVDEFVIGYPVTLNNKPSDSVKYVDPFLKRLRKLFPGKPVHLVDERFTSKLAQRAMIEAGSGKKERMDKSIIDRVSASIILQSFLEQRSFNKRKEEKK